MFNFTRFYPTLLKSESEHTCSSKFNKKEDNSNSYIIDSVAGRESNVFALNSSNEPTHGSTVDSSASHLTEEDLMAFNSLDEPTDLTSLRVDCSTNIFDTKDPG